MSNQERLVELLGYRKWEVRVPLALSSRPNSYMNPEWATIRVANLFQEYIETRISEGKAHLTGYVKCELYVSAGSRGVLTVCVSNNTVLDESLAFREPGGLMGELNFIALKILNGLQEREATIECCRTVSRLTVPRTAVVVS